MVEDLLRKIEECESKINYEKHKDNYLELLVHSYPVLSLEEEHELFRLYSINHDKSCKDILFKCHLRDVHDTCDEKTSYRVDLISEGIILLYEFIDYYDYRMPYTTFKKELVTRLTLLYNAKSVENNKSLDTKMSTYQLARLEESGKTLTDTEEILPRIKPSRPKEKLEIVPDREYLLSKERASKIFGNIFKTKKIIFKPYRRLKPDDREY